VSGNTRPWVFSRLKRLSFRNIENGLVLPVHAVWLKSQPLQKGALAFVQLMANAYPL